MINVMINYFSHPAKFPPETFYLAVTFYQFMSVYFILKKKKLSIFFASFILAWNWHGLGKKNSLFTQCFVYLWYQLQAALFLSDWISLKRVTFTPGEPNLEKRKRFFSSPTYCMEMVLTGKAMPSSGQSENGKITVSIVIYKFIFSPVLFLSFVFWTFFFTNVMSSMDSRTPVF